MKIVRYRYKNKECYGVLGEKTVSCLPTLAKRLKRHLPRRLEDFVALGENALKTAEDLLKKADADDVESTSASIGEVSLLAPIAFPPKIICLGWNYADHAAEAKAAVRDEPVIFMKPHTTIVGPNENIVKPYFVKRLDYEGELAIVMGRKAKNVPASEAEKYVSGTPY